MGKAKIKQIGKKRWSQIIEFLSKMEPPRLEHQEQCFHQNLTKIIKDDIIYLCDNEKCNSVILVVGARVLTPQQYAAESAVVNMTIAEKDQSAMNVLERFIEELEKDVEHKV